ncbi:MAG: hypothetical protein ACT4OJ_06405 [Bacteroidota bacterium]
MADDEGEVGDKEYFNDKSRTSCSAAFLFQDYYVQRFLACLRYPTLLKLRWTKTNGK